MNYQKIYESLIDRAKRENRNKLSKDNPNYVYYENHHIYLAAQEVMTIKVI